MPSFNKFFVMAQISADFLLHKTQQKKFRESDTFIIRNSKFLSIISESHQCVCVCVGGGVVCGGWCVLGGGVGVWVCAVVCAMVREWEWGLVWEFPGSRLKTLFLLKVEKSSHQTLLSMAICQLEL